MIRVLPFLVLFLVQPASAKLIYFGVDKNIEDFGVRTSLTVTFSGSGEREISIPVFSEVRNFTFSSNFGNSSCSVGKTGYGSLISCLVSPTREKRELRLSFVSEGTVKSSDRIFLYRDDIYIPEETESLFVKVSIPRGAAIVENHTDLRPYSPPDGKKATDGRRIFVIWERKNLSSGDILTIQIAYEKEENLNPGFLVLPVAALTIIFLVYFFRKRPPSYLPVLRKDEKILVDIILKHGGRTDQRILVRESGYSKAKVSRVVKSLEERGLVSVEKVGRTNKIRLKEPEKG